MKMRNGKRTRGSKKTSRMDGNRGCSKVEEGEKGEEKHGNQGGVILIV